MPDMHMDEDALEASVNLVGRTGAAGLEFGYLHDDVPAADADWWAAATYRGAKVTVEHQPGPVQALDALAARLLNGAKCVHCQRLVALSDAGAWLFTQPIADGTTITPEEVRARGTCRWSRHGRRWYRGCEPQPGRPAPAADTALADLEALLAATPERTRRRKKPGPAAKRRRAADRRKRRGR